MKRTFIFIALGVAQLLLLSAPVKAAVTEKKITTQIADKARKQFTDQRGQETRYVGQSCQAVPGDSPLWLDVLADYKGLPVRDCAPERSYTSIEGGKITVNGRALVLLPSPELIASIVVGACKANGFTNSSLKDCADAALAHVIEMNGVQFVIAGLITEPKKMGYGDSTWTFPRCAKTADEDVLFSFRDGVTVTLKGQDRSSWRAKDSDGCEALPQPTANELEKYISTDPRSVKNYGRVADIHRKKYQACTGDVVNDGKWRNLVKSNFISAWKGGTDKLLATWVRARLKPSGQCDLEKD
ncbi:hypothetical protein [Rhizobium leguminosarum]|uniref:hypothetical protein n=1 Tax=Rhizobium leguminosarum TaxID=384 RepID=UPI003F9D2CEC